MKKYFVYILTLALFIFGCAEDKGNYDYKIVNELTISGIPEKYTMENFSRLKFEPQISGTVGFNPEECEYLWFIYQGRSSTSTVFTRSVSEDQSGISRAVGGTPDTLSFEMVLDVEISAALGDYVLMFVVNNKETGLVSSFTSYLKIINSNSLGLAVLSDVEGEAAITFVSALGTVTEDLYLKINGERAGRNPTGIHYTPPGIFGTSFPSVTIFMDNERGGVVVDPYSFSHTYDYGDLFLFSPTSLKPQYALNMSGAREFIINDGRAHIRGFFDEGLTTFGIDAKGEYYLEPYLFYGGDAFGYDRINERFMNVNINPEVYEVDPSSYLFNPADMQMRLIWGTGMEKPDPDGDYEWSTMCKIRAVMERHDGTRCLISADGRVLIDADWETWIINYEYIVNPTALTEFTPANVTSISRFAMSDDEENFLYYADGDKITCMSFLTGNTLATYTVEGGTIDHMEFGSGERSNILYVGISDGSGRDKSGSIVILRMSSGGGLTEIERYPNVCGRIVDFAYVDK